MMILRVLTIAFIMIPTALWANDWTNWRGPEKNGVSRETGLPSDIDDVLWMKKDVSCRSTPIVMNDKVYVVSRIGEGADEQERVVCMDAKTGEPIWEHRFGIFFTPIVSIRLGWTVPVGDPETGNVYAHGTQGLLFCFDGETGKVRWQKSMTEEFGRITGYGGRVTSPIVEGNLVIISMISSNWGAHGGGGVRFLAFDKKTGEMVWWNTTGIRPSNTYRCVPVVTTINGRRILISGGGDGNLHAFQVNTGKKVWSFEFGNGAMNPSPVVDGNFLYAAHGEEIPGRATVGRVACLDIGGAEPKIVWEKDGIEFKYPSPMLDGGKLFLPDRQGRLYCFDAQTGERLWRAKFGRNCTGSPALGDGKIYLSSVHGYFHILDANKKGKRISRKKFQPADPRFDVEVQGSAAIANGCVYFGTTEEFYCLGKYNKTEIALPAQPGVPPADPTGEPAQLQVVPAEVTVKAGETVDFKAKLFDVRGQLIKSTPVELKLAAMKPGPGLGQGVTRPVLKGEIVGASFTAPKIAGGQSGSLLATADGLQASVRVRQVPSLPYKEDFESIGPGLIPGGWTNTQLRYVTTQLDDGNTVLMKTARIAVPFYRQWYAFIGTPDMAGYTVSADVMGEKVRDNMPNMGVTANRYILQMVGNEQKLRVSAWDAIPRVIKEIDFAWEPNEWYRLKLTVEVEGDRAHVLGKAWKRGEAEPDEWTLTLSDENPNRTGPPGLYGSALGIQPPKTGTPIYYDNIQVQ
ncbi:MAG: PQQ-binding-like beta-propeller repeat protein [Planctomycetaceae bacterium]|nr:PQQ-binding-like beta-propeller repeat protein [Planctomycetaceae bacterium]